MSQPIRAILRPLSLGLHEVEVTLQLPADAVEGGAVLALPAWTPGSYLVRDYARLLDRFQVEDSQGRPLSTPKLDKQRWQLPPTHEALTVRYRLLCNDLTVRTNHVDALHAQFLGAATFPRVEGREDLTWEVRFDGWPKTWRVATVLPSEDGAYLARDYDTLVDSPFELGNFSRHEWEQEGARFAFVFTGPHAADEERIIEGTRRIVAVCAKWFDGLPFQDYVFLLTFSPGVRGGLEHRACCSLLADPLKMGEPEALADLFRLIAHEFFHVWNVKRMRAPGLGPFDYSQECPTSLLWFHEGFTSFAQELICTQAGLLSWDAVARHLEATWTDYTTRAGRREQSLSAASWDAWIRAYKPNEFTTNTTVNYYDKGALVAWILEARLRCSTQGKQGIQALFDHLWKRHGDGPLSEEDLKRAVGKLGHFDPEPFWAAFIEGTEELESGELEAAFGLRFTSSEASATAPWIGITCQAPQTLIRNVVPGSPAAEGGLSYGMEILAVDAWRTTCAEELHRILALGEPERPLEILAADRGRVRSFRVVPTTDPNRKVRVMWDPEAGASQQKAFRSLTGLSHPAGFRP